ncbi:MAG: hypothetical protein CO170_03700 [candidate division SR1 bacterium CG_4_9_14_3_um_filter_40_9]|nr:MAG: hypothetical protein CO170_03700 [candidate division SR1 bacterium CG_4_9_14_3_um_filter_40_9]
MKLFFLKDNSLYKIFKTLEKIPNNKTIHIYIDPEHAFFDNEWWGKQIQEIIKEKSLNAYFITKTDKAKQFFQKIGLQVIHQEKHKFFKVLNLIYLFFFNIKRFHLQAYSKKNYLFYAIFGFEVVFFLVIIYLLYTLILPSATLTLTSANQIENVIYNFRYYPAGDTEYPTLSRYLSIPTSSGFIDYKYDMSLSVANVKHLQNPSQGKIRITNKTEKEYSFIKGTRLETTDGIAFRSNNRFKVPAAQGDNWGDTTIGVTAAEQDANGFLIGAKGNITKGTKVYIKLLKSSYYFKEVYGEAVDQFSGGSVESQGTITAKDIAVLSGKLVDYISKQKRNIVSQNFKLENNLLLNFDELIKPEIKSITVYNQAGEKNPLIKGSIIARLNFMYIKSDDLLAGISKYLSQRPSEKVELVNVDKSSIVFFNDIKEDKGVYIIPTKVSVIQGYNFAKDVNGILDSMKSRILGASKEEAKDIILSYPEISTVSLKVRPPRYNTLPKLKSRIKINYQQEE